MACLIAMPAALRALAVRPITTAAPIRHLRTSPDRIPSSVIRVLRSLPSMTSFRNRLLDDRRTVGLVPTMGALHAGHLSLIRAAARENHHVVVSVYLNPTQFGAAEDLGSYPTTWEADTKLLAQLDRELADDGANLGRVSAVFAPTHADMYPSGIPGQDPASDGSFVTITPLARILEGASRPTFFRGVATVCMKLFNAVRPDRVYFGQKDVQQTAVIRRLVRDFLMPIEVVVCPTERDADGMAMSSRNVYLGPRRRAAALVLSGALHTSEALYKEGCTTREELIGAALQLFEAVLRVQQELPPGKSVTMEVDYLSLADPDTMEEVAVVDPERGAVLSGAVKMHPLKQVGEGEDVGHAGGPEVRLIDNIILKPRRNDA